MSNSILDNSSALSRLKTRTGLRVSKASISNYSLFNKVQRRVRDYYEELIENTSSKSGIRRCEKFLDQAEKKLEKLSEDQLLILSRVSEDEDFINDLNTLEIQKDAPIRSTNLEEVENPTQQGEIKTENIVFEDFAVYSEATIED